MGTPTSTCAHVLRYRAAWAYLTDRSGLLQLGARFYWPEIGRFIQQDPIGDGMNWYAYAGNNPLRWVDPEGLEDTTSMWRNLFQPESGQQLGMSARATASGFARGFTFGGWQPDWSDPCDPWADFSKAGGRVAGTAAALVVGAKITGLNPEFRYLPGRGGFEIKWTRNFRTGWHRFRLGDRSVNRPHYHRRPGIGNHRPWQGGW